MSEQTVELTSQGKMDRAHAMTGAMRKFLQQPALDGYPQLDQAKVVIREFEELLADHEEWCVEGYTRRYGRQKPPPLNVLQFRKVMAALGFPSRGDKVKFHPVQHDFEVRPRFGNTRPQNIHLIYKQLLEGGLQWHAAQFMREVKAHPTGTPWNVAERLVHVHMVK